MPASKLPMIEVPAIKDRALAEYVEKELAPYEGEELVAAKGAVRTYATNRAYLGTRNEHMANYARVIREAVETVRAKRPRGKAAPATDTA